MKQLNNFINEKLKISETSFILEKLKISSKSKINNNSIQDLYCLVHPKEVSDTFNKFMDDYEDAFIYNDEGGYFFIILKDEIKKYKNNEYIKIYKIPDKYNNLDDLEDDFKTYKITLKDMEKINL